MSADKQLADAFQNACLSAWLAQVETQRVVIGLSEIVARDSQDEAARAKLSAIAGALIALTDQFEAAVLAFKESKESAAADSGQVS